MCHGIHRQSSDLSCAVVAKAPVVSSKRSSNALVANVMNQNTGLAFVIEAIIVWANQVSAQSLSNPWQLLPLHLASPLGPVMPL